MLQTLLEDLERARELGAIHWAAYLPTVVLLIAGAALLYYGMRRATTFKVLLLCLGVLCVLRAAVYNTPLTWYAFFKLYDSQDIGFRERNMIAYNIDKYFVRSERTRYLAIGSSQARLFKDLSVADKNFSLQSFAGLMPLEYLLYDDLIDTKRPDNVILYLSEFDLAREPTLSAVELDPLPLHRIGWLYQRIEQFYDADAAFSTLKHMAVGALSPEYRHGYLFRPLTAKLFDERSANEQGTMSAEQWTMTQAMGLREKLDGKYLVRNVHLIDEFIQYCVGRGAHVYVIEGQYHPAAYDAKLTGLRNESRELLAGIAARQPKVTFIPLEQQPSLTAADYVDGYHISEEAAHRFSTALLQIVNERAAEHDR